MSDFTAPLLLSPGVGGLWRTERAFAFEIGCKGSSLAVVVPEGFATDLGTIPPGFRWLINPADASCAAAFVLHDYLCRWLGFDRTTADGVLYGALRVLGVARWKALVIFAGVTAYRLAMAED